MGVTFLWFGNLFYEKTCKKSYFFCHNTCFNIDNYCKSIPPYCVSYMVRWYISVRPSAFGNVNVLRSNSSSYCYFKQNFEYELVAMQWQARIIVCVTDSVWPNFHCWLILEFSLYFCRVVVSCFFIWALVIVTCSSGLQEEGSELKGQGGEG